MSARKIEVLLTTARDGTNRPTFTFFPARVAGNAGEVVNVRMTYRPGPNYTIAMPGKPYVGLTPNFSDTGEITLTAGMPPLRVSNNAIGAEAVLYFDVKAPTPEPKPDPKPDVKGLKLACGAKGIPDPNYAELGLQGESFWYGLDPKDTSRPNSNFVKEYMDAHPDAVAIIRFGRARGNTPAETPPGNTPDDWLTWWTNKLTPILTDLKPYQKRLKLEGINEPNDPAYLKIPDKPQEFDGTDNQWRAKVCVERIAIPLYRAAKSIDKGWVVLSSPITQTNLFSELKAAGFYVPGSTCDEASFHPYGDTAALAGYTTAYDSLGIPYNASEGGEGVFREAALITEAEQDAYFALALQKFKWFAYYIAFVDGKPDKFSHALMVPGEDGKLVPHQPFYDSFKKA